MAGILMHSSRVVTQKIEQRILPCAMCTKTVTASGRIQTPSGLAVMTAMSQLRTPGRKFRRSSRILPPIVQCRRSVDTEKGPQ